MKVQDSQLQPLIRGIDTLQLTFFLQGGDISYSYLDGVKNDLKSNKKQKAAVVELGGVEFLLYPRGSVSGYPYIISNKDFIIEFGQYNVPNFFVKFLSEALWRENEFKLLEKFLAWAASLSFDVDVKETVSRVDFCFDYYLPVIDFSEDNFVSASIKDNQFREFGKLQTISIGKGDMRFRIYDKVAEIRQASDKIWLYNLWERCENVWRLEWQLRRGFLKHWSVKSLHDLHAMRKSILTYLTQHTSLRVPTSDKPSKWPLHPVWQNLVHQIDDMLEPDIEMGLFDVGFDLDENAVLREKEFKLMSIMYGYLKTLTAYSCELRGAMTTWSFRLACEQAGRRMEQIHNESLWLDDVGEKRSLISKGRY